MEIHVCLGEGNAVTRGLQRRLGLGIEVVEERTVISRLGVDEHLEVHAGIRQFAQPDKRRRVLENPIFIINQLLVLFE